MTTKLLTDADRMDEGRKVHALVLEGVPGNQNEAAIIDHVEFCLNVDVREVRLHATEANKVLVIFQKALPDFHSASRKICNEKWEEQTIEALPSFLDPTAVFVKDIDPSLLSSEFLEIYFCSVFGDGNDIVRSCNVFSGYNVAVVHFSCPEQDVVSILQDQDHIPLPSENYHITLEQFYTNFHEQPNRFPNAFNRKPVPENKPAPRIIYSGNSSTRGRGSGRARGFSQKRSRFGQGTTQSTNQREAVRDWKGISHCKPQDNLAVKNVSRDFSPENQRMPGSGRAHEKLIENLAITTESSNSKASESKISKQTRGNRGKRGKAWYISTLQPDSWRAKNEEMAEKMQDSCHTPQIEDEINRRGSVISEKSTKSQEETDRRQLEAKEAEIEALRKQLAEAQKTPYIIKEKVPAYKRKLLKSCEGSFDKCIVKYDALEEEFVLEGIEEKAKECQIKLLKAFKAIKEGCIPVPLAMQTMFSDHRREQSLSNLRKKCADGEAHYDSKKKAIIILALNDEKLDKCMKALKEALAATKTVKETSSIQPTDFDALKRSVRPHLLVYLSLSEDRKTVTIGGLEPDVQEAAREVNTSLSKIRMVTKKYKLEGLQARFINTYQQHLISFVSTTVGNVPDVKRDDLLFEVTIKGPTEKTEEAFQYLQQKEKQILSKTWVLSSEFTKSEDLMLVEKGLKAMTNSFDRFQWKETCLIDVEIKETGKRFQKGKQGNERRKKRNFHRVTKERRPKVVAATRHISAKRIYDVNSSCKFVLKPYGDITKESSDILVCLLDSQVDLRKTRVGLSFNKACPELWKQLNTAKESLPGSPVLITPGPFKTLRCRSICHVILSRWDPNTSAALLSQAIGTILKHAADTSAKSISMPPLGPGRALQFPPSTAAQIVIKAIVSAASNLSLSKIVIVVPDTSLFGEFKKEADSQIKQSATGAVGGKEENSDEDTDDQNGAGSADSPGTEENVEKGDGDDSEDSTDDDDDDEEMSLQTPVDSHNGDKKSKITITFESKEKDRGAFLWAKLKKDIEEMFLHVGHFNQDQLENFPKDFRKKVIEEAIQNDVWVTRSAHPKTKKAGFLLRGEKTSVEKLVKAINVYFKEFQEAQQKKLADLPERGNVKFLRLASECSEFYPSYWTGKKKSVWNSIKSAFNMKDGLPCVPVNDETKQSIISLVNSLFDPRIVGYGNDAVNLTHTGIKVTGVLRVENKDLFEVYAERRRRLFKKMAKEGKLCARVKALPGSKGAIETTQMMDGFMKKELFYEVNEHYLFHGTKKETLSAVVHNGPDSRVGSEGAMFGRGVYSAEKFTKADQYTDHRDARTSHGTKLYVILARVLLGEVFLCNDKHESVQSKASKKLSRPPCKHCLKDVCPCPKQELFDSVMGDGKWNFREFVVYDNHNIYPEYVIEYERH